MTVTLYIPRRRGAEKGFDHVFERNAAVEIANKFHDTYQDNPTEYALVFNPDAPPADLIVITNYGIGVVELKNITGVIRGTVNSPWTIDQNNTNRELEVSHKYRNPFQQVRTYRLDLYHRMKDFARRLPDGKLPGWMRENGQFHLQAAVVFTDDCQIELDLEPKLTKPWFEAIHQAKLTQWAYTLTFTSQGTREPLSEDQIELITDQLLQVDEWDEMSKLIQGAEIFGYLNVYDSNGQAPTQHPLRQMQTTVGREATNDIPVGATGISRQHAQIVWDGDHAYIQDVGSTNGTWLNGDKLPPDQRQRLQDGDQLIFGPCTDGEPKESARRATYTVRLPTLPETQVFYPVS